MILDSLGLDYEILEANNDRIGGRIYTHRFNGDVGRKAPINDPARYDYIDIGAMRYPNIPFMKRVFDLFYRLDMTELLIEYKYSAANTFEFYNGVRVNTSDSNKHVDVLDVFGVSVSKGGNVPDSFVAYGVDNVAADVYKPFAEKFKNDPFEVAWDYLTAQDAFSTRGYMLEKCYLETTGEKYTPQVVEWLETFQTGTGLYNLAFVESTMDALDFGSDTAKSDPGSAQNLDYSWYCIDGGSDHITSRMVEKIKHKPILGKRATKIASQHRLRDTVVEVTYKDESGIESSKPYSQVISTVPLGSLAAIDIPRHDLSYVQRLAIRALNYDTSTKVALKFESRWWEDPKIMNDRPIQGGTSPGDIPIRTCVYPSYGFQSVSPPPGDLLASYTWAQDAQRLGGLAQGNGTKADAQLIELTLNNLSELHGLPKESFGRLVDHYAYDWHNDENARGAFALFGPGQFGHPGEETSLFASMKMPGAGGLLHFAGEATSVHHAWVLGALNSAWRAVYSALGNLEDGAALRTKMTTDWGTPDEEDVIQLVQLAALAEKFK